MECKGILNQIHENQLQSLRTNPFFGYKRPPTINAGCGSNADHVRELIPVCKNPKGYIPEPLLVRDIAFRVFDIQIPVLAGYGSTTYNSASTRRS